MVLWAAEAFFFLGLALFVPLIGQRVGISSITAGNFMIIALIAVIFMAGFEVNKIVYSLVGAQLGIEVPRNERNGIQRTVRSWVQTVNTFIHHSTHGKT